MISPETIHELERVQGLLRALVEDDGYQREELWSEEGNIWRTRNAITHEYQWEVASCIGLLDDSGRVWEWCANPFAPYEGFKAFPYAEYSTPWFDGRHRSLRGGSLHTQPRIKRPSFRNFYEPDKRHIFAGLRLIH